MCCVSFACFKHGTNCLAYGPFKQVNKSITFYFNTFFPDKNIHLVGQVKHHIFLTKKSTLFQEMTYPLCTVLSVFSQLVKPRCL